MFIITAPCWSCHKDMQVALVGSESANFLYGPEVFSKSEQELAVQNGVCLKTVRSATAQETYLANICRECDQFVGKFYFFAHYFAPALHGEFEYKKIDLGKADREGRIP